MSKFLQQADLNGQILKSLASISTIAIVQKAESQKLI